MAYGLPPLGDIKVGDEVFVERSSNDMRGRDKSDRYIPARITKVARVWIEIESTDGARRWPRNWRMRRDTQNQGTQYIGSDARFLTPAQHEQVERLRVAMTFLREQGITVERNSPWLDRTPELADLIRSHITPEGEVR